MNTILIDPHVRLEILMPPTICTLLSVLSLSYKIDCLGLHEIIFEFFSSCRISRCIHFSVARHVVHDPIVRSLLLLPYLFQLLQAFCFILCASLCFHFCLNFIKTIFLLLRQIWMSFFLCFVQLVYNGVVFFHFGTANIFRTVEAYLSINHGRCLSDKAFELSLKMGIVFMDMPVLQHNHETNLFQILPSSVHHVDE